MKLLKKMLLWLLNATRSAQVDARLLLKATCLAAITIALVSAVLMQGSSVLESWKLIAECMLLLSGSLFTKKE